MYPRPRTTWVEYWLYLYGVPQGSVGMGVNDIYNFDQKGIWQLKSTNIASWQPHFEPHRIWSEWKLTYRQYTNIIYDLTSLASNEIIFTCRFNVRSYDNQMKKHNIIWKCLKLINTGCLFYFTGNKTLISQDLMNRFGQTWSHSTHFVMEFFVGKQWYPCYSRCSAISTQSAGYI